MQLFEEISMQLPNVISHELLLTEIYSYGLTKH